MKLEFFEDRLTGRWGISFWQWLIAVPLSIYFSFERINKLTDLGPQASLLISIFNSISTGLAYLIASKVILKNRFTIKQSLERVLLTYVFISVFTSLLEMFFSAVLFGQKPLIGTQFMTPVFPNFIALVATASLVAEFAFSNQRLKDISNLNQKLITNDTAIAHEFEGEKKQLISGINDYLIPQLGKVKEAFHSAMLSSSQSDKLIAIEEIGTYATNSVRRLSHELYSKEFSDFNSPELIKESRIKFSSNMYQPIISMKLVLAFGILIGGSQQLSLNGPKGFVYNIVAISIISFLGFLSNQIFQTMKPENIELKYYYFVFHLFLVGSISAVLFRYLQNDFFNLDFKYGTGQVIFRNVTNVLLSSAIVILMQGRQELGFQIESLNQKLESQLVTRKLLLADLRDKVASVLHGQIQGRLSGIALALRVEADISIDRNKEEEIARTIGLIEDELANILQTVLHDDDTELAVGIQEVTRDWKSIVNIEIELDIDQELDDDKSLTKKVKLALHEAIANAVRHGRAKNIQVVVKRYRKASKNLHLIIINDGLPLPENRTSGLGFKNLDVSTADWKISNLENGKVAVEAII